MAIIGRLPDINKHFALNQYFETAFQYFTEALSAGTQVSNRIKNLPLGAFDKVDLGFGIFAIEQKFESKERSDCYLESHKKFIDIQLIVSGQELMEHCDISRCVEKIPYNKEKDLILYQDNIDMNKISMISGDFAIYFPVDVHLGCQKYKEQTLCTKTVVKMPVIYF